MKRIKEALSNEVVAVGCVAFAGLLLRLHGLEDQSAWSDEWCSIVNDPSMTMSEFFALHRYRNPDHVPLYYLLVYAWSMLISPSLYSVRLISIAFATLAVPVVYLCGREVGGKRAGLVMAALFCVSPYFTFQAQGIRPYALVLLLCAIVLLSLMRATHSRGVGWWWVNYLANMLLIYVHLAGTFFLAAQGLYLLLLYRRRLMPVVLWSAAHFLSLLPAVLSMMVPPQDPMFEIPDLTALMNNLFADDAAGRNIELIYGYPAWKYSHPAAWEMVFSLRPYMGHAMVAVFGLLTAWAMLVLVRSLFRVEAIESDRRRHAALALMLFVAVVPTLMLLVVSYIKEPMPMPRYTVYSNLGLFGMAGAFVASARSAWLRSGALAALAALYLYQIIYTINTPVRTEWLAVRDEIKRAAAPDDEILVSCYGDPWFDLDRPGELMFRTAYGPAQQAISCVRTQEGLLRRAAEGLIKSAPEKSVWLVIYRVYDKRPLPEIEAAFSGQSLEFQRWDYEAMEGLTLYRVKRGDAIPRLDNLGEVPHLTPADADQVLSDWDIALDTPSERDEAHRALRRLLDRPPPHPLGAMSYAYLSLLAGVEAPKLALHLAESSLSYEPELATAHFARGIALLQLGRLEEGIASFKTAQAAPVDELHAFISPLLEALIARDFVSAEKRMERYMLLGGPMTSALPVWLAQHNAAPAPEVTQAVPQE